MKQFVSSISFFLAISLFASCEKEENLTGKNQQDSTQQKKIQFYADPAKFNADSSGIVIMSIAVNGKFYIPKSTNGNCSDNYIFAKTSSQNGADFMKYRINYRNYNSLDAVMQGLPYTDAYSEGVIYEYSLESGCNNLYVEEAFGAQLFTLGIN